MLNRVELKKPFRVIDPVEDAEVPYPMLVQSGQICRHVTKGLAHQFRMGRKVRYFFTDTARHCGVELPKVPLKAGSGKNSVSFVHVSTLAFKIMGLSSVLRGHI